MTKPKKTNKISSQSIPCRSSEILSRSHDDGTVTVLHLDSDQHFFTISGLAVEVWGCVNGKASVAEIEKLVRKKHKNLPAKFKDDVANFIYDLKKERLIEMKPVKVV